VSAALLNDRRICPSILASDFSRLGEQVASVMDAGARIIHVDVMDGHFVPPISIGASVAASIQAQVHDAGGWIDVHLMIERPEHHVQEFADAGADSIAVHFEATPDIHFALKAVREAGCHAGLALNPGTSLSAVDSLHGSFDHLLCMTVNPGWGGQKWIPQSNDRVAELRSRLPADVPIQVDGGVDLDTVGPATTAGAGLLVAGSSVFGAADPAAAYTELAAAAQAV
jgi:ribulose-phosphate 3-epimerase